MTLDRLAVEVSLKQAVIYSATMYCIERAAMQWLRTGIGYLEKSVGSPDWTQSTDSSLPARQHRRLPWHHSIHLGNLSNPLERGHCRRILKSEIRDFTREMLCHGRQRKKSPCLSTVIME